MEWVSTLPGGLAELAPGAELAGLLESLDPSVVDDDELTGLIAARARQIAHQQALMLVEILRAARRVVADQRPEEWASRAQRYAADVIGMTLHCSVRWAQSQIDLAQGLEDLPMVYAALLAGRIDEARACAFVSALGFIEDRALAAQIATRLLVKAPGWTLAELRERLRYHIDRRDPKAARRRYSRRVADRNVSLGDGWEGTASLLGYNLPADRATAAYDRVDRLARCARAAGDPRTLAQLRADAYVDLLAGTPFQLAPTIDPLTAQADAADRDDWAEWGGRRPDPTDAPVPDLPGPEPIGAYDYESASIPRHRSAVAGRPHRPWIRARR